MKTVGSSVAVVILTGLAGVLGVGCDTVKDGARAISTSTTAAVATVPGQTQPPAPIDTGNANSVTCATEREMFELAVTSYELLEGAPPASEAALVPDYLVSESTLFDLSPTGEIIPAPGTGC